MSSSGRRNLLQIISMAGGFSATAGNEVFILREGPDGGTSSITIDLKDLLVNRNQELNIPIEPNDVINVPVDREIRVFVMGRVNHPGAIKAKLSEGDHAAAGDRGGRGSGGGGQADGDHDPAQGPDREGDQVQGEPEGHHQGQEDGHAAAGRRHRDRAGVVLVERGHR